MTSGDVTIRRLTLRMPDRGDGRRDTGAARSRLDRLLDDVDWRPAGYRPGQVWVIRRLGNLPALDARPDRGWIAAVEAVLDALFRHALRVKPGIPPGAAEHADSLLFEDRADWLALLTGEVVDGRVWTRWYWHATLSELRTRDAGALLGSVWRSFPEHLPAGLCMLPAACVERAVALLAPAEVSRVVRALQQRYSLAPDILTAAIPDTPTAVFGGRLPAPWERWTPPPRATLTPQAHYLYGLLVTLNRSLGDARSTAFARSASAWLVNELAREQAAPPNDAASERRRGIEPAATRGDWHTAWVAPPGEAPAVYMSPPDPYDATLVPRVEEPAAARPATDGAAETATPDGRIGAELTTELGGVLFLIHALAWLDLPDLHGENVGAWGWIDVAARALLGAVPADPIWDALRTLDGRDKQALIGADWKPEEFRLSRRTVERYLTGQWRAAIRNGRLLLARGNVLVLDTPAAEPGRHTIADAIRRYTEDDDPQWEPGGLPAPFVVPPSLRSVAVAGVLGFLARAMPCLIHLLRRGLGDEALPIEHIARRVLLRNGQLCITRTHVDLFLALDSADIMVRRAGLDCNPGWLPSYGYIVQFHYDGSGEARR